MTIRDITYAGEGLIPMSLNGPALRYTPLPKAAVTDIAIHHWTGFLPPATWTAGEEIAYIRRIDQYHRTERGLDGIGYHIAPFPSGRVYIVSRLDHYGAHVGGKNDHLLGIGLPGSFNVNLPSPQHLAATVEAVRYAYGYLGRVVPTQPHLYWGGTSCPGDRWPEWVPQLQTAALEEDDMPSIDDIVAALGPVIETKVQEGMRDAIAAQPNVRRLCLEAIDQFDRKHKRFHPHRGWQLVKGSANDVYLVTRGRKFHLGNLEGFTYSGYRWGDVQTIPDDKLAKILDG